MINVSIILRRYTEALFGWGDLKGNDRRERIKTKIPYFENKIEFEGEARKGSPSLLNFDQLLLSFLFLTLSVYIKIVND